MRGRNPSADSGAGPYSGDAEGGSMPPSAPSPWDGRKAINPSSFVSKFVELDPFCSFVRTIQYAIDFGMILFRSRVSHSQFSLEGPWGGRAYPCVDERACRLPCGSR
jgi:hypothetical protein